MSTNSQPLHLIVDLNNRGVDFLEKGRLREAATVLCDALVVARQRLNSEHDEPAPVRLQVAEAQPARVKSSVIYPRNGTIFPDDDDEDHMTNFGPRALLESNQRFLHEVEIFRRAYRLSNDLAGCPSTCSLTCLFNLALTHHLWSLDSSCSDDKPTPHAALRLYELAYSLLVQQAQDLSGGIMTLAIVNNLAQIHNACNDASKAAHCREHLVSLYMYFQECSDVDLSEVSGPILATLSRQLLHDPATSPAA